MPDPVRMGVVGAGTISLRGIFPHLSQEDVQDRVTLAAVCDPVEGRAEAAAVRFGVEKAFLSCEELLKEGGVDAVVIATPIGLHYEQGKQALDAGKHVYFNKTMTVTTAEATDLIDTANAKGLKMVASPGEMLRPHNRRIKKLLAEGAIGTVCWAVCGAAFVTYHEDEPERAAAQGAPPIDPSWYYRKPGGGPLYDMTVYALHAMTGILGPVRRVTAMSGIRLRERQFAGHTVAGDADDNTLILLDFGDSLFAMAYGTAAGALNRWDDFSGRYYGTTGEIIGLLMNGEPFDYPGREIARQHPAGALIPAAGGGNEWILPHVEGVHRDIGEQHVYEDIMQLVDWVREDKPSIVTAEHARHVIEIIEAAYRAAGTGHTQELATTFDDALEPEDDNDRRIAGPAN